MSARRKRGRLSRQTQARYESGRVAAEQRKHGVKLHSALHTLETQRDRQRLQQLIRSRMNEWSGEGEIAGLLALAAEYAAPKLTEQHALAPDEPIVPYLTMILGETLHRFDPAVFRAWNDARRERTLAVLNGGAP